MTACLGKSCSFGLPRVHFVNCRRFMYLVISLLVYRAGCGIRLCQFLINAYLFILDAVFPKDLFSDYLELTTAVVVPCGGPKKSPRISI